MILNRFGHVSCSDGLGGREIGNRAGELEGSVKCARPEVELGHCGTQARLIPGLDLNSHTSFGPTKAFLVRLSSESRNDSRKEERTQYQGHYQ